MLKNIGGLNKIKIIKRGSDVGASIKVLLRLLGSQKNLY